MSLTPQGRGADRSFDIVRQSLWQSDDLPFQDALTVEQMRQALAAEGVAFGEGVACGEDGDSAHAESQPVFTRGVTLWAMLSQALFTDVQRSCRAAVQRVAVYGVLLGREAPSTNTGVEWKPRVLPRAGEGSGGRGPPSGRGRGPTV